MDSLPDMAVRPPNAKTSGDEAAAARTRHSIETSKLLLARPVAPAWWTGEREPPRDDQDDPPAE